MVESIGMHADRLDAMATLHNQTVQHMQGESIAVRTQVAEDVKTACD